MNSNRNYGLLVVPLIVLSGVAVIGFSRGWFSRSEIDARNVNGKVDSPKEHDTASDKRKPRKLADALGVKEDDLAVIGGVLRSKKDSNFSEPSRVDYGKKNPVPFAGLPKPVSLDANESVKALVKDFIEPEKKQLATSIYAKLEEFDKVKYQADPDAYLLLTRPSRVNQSAQAGEGVIPLEAGSPIFTQVIQGEIVVLRVRGMSGMPLTFHTNQVGSFSNKLKTMSMAFDEKGEATAEFKTGSAVGLTNVLVASPVHSRQLKFVVRVLLGEEP